MKYNVDIDDRLKMPDDLISKHWDLPVYTILQGDITEDSTKKFLDCFYMAMAAGKKSGQKILPVVINSRGGDVYSCLEIVDTMKSCPIPIATIVEGRAMSAGAIIFSCGTNGHRYVAPNATVMIHAVTTGRRAKIDEVIANTEEGSRLNSKLFDMLDQNCGQKDNYFKNLIKENNGSDLYLDAAGAVKHGLANHIRIPEFNVKVSIASQFE